MDKPRRKNAVKRRAHTRIFLKLITISVESHNNNISIKSRVYSDFICTFIHKLLVKNEKWWNKLLYELLVHCARCTIEMYGFQSQNWIATCCTIIRHRFNIENAAFSRLCKQELPRKKTDWTAIFVSPIRFHGTCFSKTSSNGKVNEINLNWIFNGKKWLTKQCSKMTNRNEMATKPMYCNETLTYEYWVHVSFFLSLCHHSFTIVLMVKYSIEYWII